ncbi:MAG TPA: ACP S-malonyltransferase, partial [Chitinophagaceae bacterium]|nr:ACP S-malonyltransferase [Chitinophagaceae bacterium]
MKHAYVFPGQGSQFPGMAREHYDNSAFAKKLFEQANELLGFRISDTMFNGTEEDLKQTNVTQPAVFLHSVIAFKSIDNARPEMVAGHSLGEFSALVANGVLSFEDALQLVAIRARAMQKACELNPSTMAAILALADEKVEEICREVEQETREVVVPANYNCPGQL